MNCEKCNAEMVCEHVGAGENRWFCVVCRETTTPKPEPVDPPNDAWVFILMIVLAPFIYLYEWIKEKYNQYEKKKGAGR